MKWGTPPVSLGYEERNRRVFAWWPTWCKDIKQWVWMERVWYREYWSDGCSDPFVESLPGWRTYYASYREPNG